MTMHHTLGAQNSRSVFSGCWRPEVQDQGVSRVSPSQGSEENPQGLLWSLALPAGLGTRLYHPSPLPSLHPPPLASCSSPSASSCWEPGFGFRAHPCPGGLHLRTLCLNKSHAGSGGPRGEPVFSGGRVQPPAVSIWYFHLLPWEASSTSPHRVGSIPVPPTWEGVQPKSPKTGHCRVTTHI